MVNINSTSLNAKYQEFADALINQVNATQMTLVFDTDIATTGVIDNLSPLGFDLLGGRVSQHELDDTPDASGTGLQPVSATGSITVRCYWERSKDDANAASVGVRNRQHKCKIISFATDIPAMRNAQHAIINNEKVTMVEDATYHGMFGDKRYATTFWQIME